MHIVNQRQRILSETEILISITAGGSCDGYDIVRQGTDENGRSYTDIRTPDGRIERVENIDNILEIITEGDRYNSIHLHRRDGDRIMLYYDIGADEICVVAVKPDDNLSSAPFMFSPVSL